MTWNNQTGEGFSPEPLPLPEGLLLVSDPHDVYFQQAWDIQKRAFVQSGYFDSDDQFDAKYTRYLPYSCCIVGVVDDVVMGSVQLLLPNPHGLITIEDAKSGLLKIDDQGWELLRQCDPCTLLECNISVDNAYRGRPFDPNNLPNRLVAGAVLFSMRFAMEKLGAQARSLAIAGLDQSYYHFLQRQEYGPAIHPLGPVTEDYLGGPTIPVLVDGDEIAAYTNVRRVIEPMLRALGRLTQK